MTHRNPCLGTRARSSALLVLAAAWAGCGEVKGAGPDAAIDASPADAARDVDAAVIDATPPDAAPCDRGDVNAVDPATGSCYMLFANGRSWTAARAVCEGLGPSSDLAAITSTEESAFVTSMLVGTRDVWLGANDLVTARQWEWVTGEPFQFTNWSGGQPDNSGEHCVRADGGDQGRWHDDSCGDAWPFLCEQ